MEINIANSFQIFSLDNIDMLINISSRNKNSRILKSAVRPCSIGAFEEPNYEGGLIGT